MLCFTCFSSLLAEAFLLVFLPAEPGKFSETGAIKALFVELCHVLLCHVF
jgi:hypothetical protein